MNKIKWWQWILIIVFGGIIFYLVYPKYELELNKVPTRIWIIIIIIQALLLFLKSALNDILVAWYKHIKERKREEREYLIKTYQYLSKMLNEFISIFFLHQSINDAKPSERQLYSIYQKRALDRFSELQDSVDKIKIRLPENVREIVDRVLSEMTPKFRDALVGVSPDKILEKINRCF
ncbi:hypothetical protein ES705_01723 [subsurface metagenome]|nr:hypothetical protein [Clostridia bacterium]